MQSRTNRGLALLGGGPRGDRGLKIAITLCMLAVVVAMLLALFGCSSHTRNIASAAQKSGQEAGEIVQHAKAAQAELDAPPEEVPATPPVLAWLGSIKSHLLAIEKKAGNVRTHAATIGQEVTHVEDKVPWWAALLKLFAVLGILAVLLYFFVATGAMKVVRGIVWGMGKLIPARALTAAKFDFEHHQKHPDDVEHREAVAANRGKDPAYDAAWRKFKQEAEEKKTE